MNEHTRSRRDDPLRDGLHPFSGHHHLRWISLGATKKKPWPGDQNNANKAAYWRFVKKDHSKSNAAYIQKVFA
jgi:hypothetical protein